MKTMVQLRKLHIPFLPESSIDLTVSAGSVIGITGGMGCGKSQMLRYIAGVSRPKEMGQVLVDGLDPYSHLDERKLRKVAGLVPQRAAEAFFLPSMGRDLALGAENAGWESAKVRELVKEEMKAFGLETARKKRLSALSGSEAIRAAVAGLMVGDPELILLDDVFCQMNRGEAFRILKGITDAARKSGRTVIFVSRRKNELRLADTIYEMREGSLYDCTELIMHASDLGMDIEEDEDISPEEYLKKYLKQKENHDSSEERKRPKKSASQPKLGVVCSGISLRGASPFLLVSGLKVCGNMVPDINLLEGGSYRLTGRGGTGKTTLLNMLAGRFPHTPGTIRFENELEADEKQLVKAAGFASADPAQDFLRDTVIEDVAVGLPSSMSKEEKKDRARAALFMTGFPDEKLQKNPTRLSFGEKRLVSLAGAMIRTGGILLLDNPYAGLDEASQKKVQAALRAERKKGCCVVYTDPDREE